MKIQFEPGDVVYIILENNYRYKAIVTNVNDSDVDISIIDHLSVFSKESCYLDTESIPIFKKKVDKQRCIVSENIEDLYKYYV